MAGGPPLLSLSLPGAPGGAALFACGLAGGLLFGARALRHARRLANRLFDRSEVEETLCAVFPDPLHPTRRLLIPLELDEAGPVTLEGDDLPVGEKCVLRWREGAFGHAYAVDALATGIPVDPDELPEAFAASGTEATLPLADLDPASGTFRPPSRAGFPRIPVEPSSPPSFASTLLAAAAGVLLLAFAALCANAALDPTPARRAKAYFGGVVDGPFGLKFATFAPPGETSFTTAIPAALATFPVERGNLLLDHRPGLFRLRWVAGVSPLEALPSVAAPASAPSKEEVLSGEPRPGEIPTRADALKLKREAFGATDPTRSRLLVARLEKAGALTLALDLAESYAEVFADDPDFLLLAARIARGLGEETHARLLLARGNARFPKDERFR